MRQRRVAMSTIPNQEAPPCPQCKVPMRFVEQVTTEFGPGQQYCCDGCSRTHNVVVSSYRYHTTRRCACGGTMTQENGAYKCQKCGGVMMPGGRKYW